MNQKDVRIVDVLDQIGKESDTHIELDAEAASFKLNVFVEDLSARDLLERIASIIDFETEFTGNVCHLKCNRGKREDFLLYLEREDRVTRRPILEKLSALAGVTEYRFGETPSSPAIPLENETALQWAQRKAVQPAFYAAGLWWKTYLRSGTSMPSPLRGLLPGSPWVFWVGRIDEATQRLDPLPHPIPVVAIDENSVPIENTTIQLFSYGTTGELRVAGVNCECDEDAPGQRYFLYSRPPLELAKLGFAKRLAGWETGLAGVSKSTLTGDLKSRKRPDDPGYFGGRISLSEKLQFISQSTGIPIVATSFRAPALDQDYPTGDTPEALLKALSKSEQVIMRYEGTTLLVRHPAYWLLMCSEPDELTLKEVEKAARSRSLGLRDYGRVAVAIECADDRVPPWKRSLPRTGPSSAWGTDRLPACRGFLFRFDPEPLLRAYPALVFVGSLLEAEWTAFVSGAPVGDLKVPGPMDVYKTNWVGPTSEYRPGAAAYPGPLFGSTVMDHYITPAERARQMSPYRPFGLKASCGWLEPQVGDSYRISFGFPHDPIVTYDFSIPANPPSDEGGTCGTSTDRQGGRQSPDRLAGTAAREGLSGLFWFPE